MKKYTPLILIIVILLIIVIVYLYMKNKKTTSSVTSTPPITGSQNQLQTAETNAEASGLNWLASVFQPKSSTSVTT